MNTPAETAAAIKITAQTVLVPTGDALDDVGRVPGPKLIDDRENLCSSSTRYRTWLRASARSRPGSTRPAEVESSRTGTSRPASWKHRPAGRLAVGVGMIETSATDAFWSAGSRFRARPALVVVAGRPRADWNSVTLYSPRSTACEMTYGLSNRR